MNASAFYPPNIHLLSENVIALVPSSSRTIRIANRDVGACTHLPLQLTEGDGGFTPKTRKRSSVAVKRHATDHQAVAELVEVGKTTRRKQLRESQHRYRQKQKSFLANLENTTQRLQAEVELLERQHSQMATRAPTMVDVWSVVIEYFRVFRHGLDPRPRVNNVKAVPFDSHDEFVREAMTPDVATNNGYGPDAVIKSWHFSQWFGDVEVELQGLKGSTKGLVTATTETRLTITEQALCSVFPHLCSPSSGNSAHKLADKLLNQRIVVRGSTCFQWDGASGLVARVVTQHDLLTPMLQLLGSLEDVSQVLDKAGVSSDLQWR